MLVMSLVPNACFSAMRDRTKKMIDAKSQEINAMLFDATGLGNKDMVEFLVKECHANPEEGGTYSYSFKSFHSVTPLRHAAIRGKLEVVKLLQELGANINAVSNTELTSVNYACCRRHVETAKFLVKQRANINRPDERGETCLMNSVHCLELCQFLIDNGARVNKQDRLGNTALRHAIENDYLEIVQLLLDHGSNQNVKNKLGDDALQFASLRGKEKIVMELVASQKPTPSRLFESLQLLGSYSFFCETVHSVQQALIFWRRSVELRMMNPCVQLCEIEPTSVCMIVNEVHTVDELEELYQDQEMVHMYALENLLRILGPNHKETARGLAFAGEVLARNGKYRRSFDLIKYVFQLQQKCTPAWIREYLNVLKMLCTTCSDEKLFQIEFHEVLKTLDMVTSMAQFGLKLSIHDIHGVSHFLHLILSFVLLTFKLDKSPDQMDVFQLQQKCTPAWIREYLNVPKMLCTACSDEKLFQIEFHEVLKILDMVTSMAQFGLKLSIHDIHGISHFLHLILSFVLLTFKLDKSPDQMVSFKQVIRRLVRSQIRDEDGQTFLHCAALLFETYPGVAKVLLECGADVNAVDSEHNTALHSCTGPYAILGSVLQNKIIKLLLQYSAHLDIVNDQGHIAAMGLSLNMLDHVNLKCLATAVFRDHQIPYVGQIPKSLESFVHICMEDVHQGIFNSDLYLLSIMNPKCFLKRAIIHLNFR